MRRRQATLQCFIDVENTPKEGLTPSSGYACREDVHKNGVSLYIALFGAASVSVKGDSLFGSMI